jgi:hypothetical protein
MLKAILILALIIFVMPKIILGVVNFTIKRKRLYIYNKYNKGEITYDEYVKQRKSLEALYKQIWKNKSNHSQN